MVGAMVKSRSRKRMSAAVSVLSILALCAIAVSLGCPNGQTDHVVSIPDPGFEAAIRDSLNMPGGPIYASQLRAFVAIDCSGREIQDLGGIEHFTNWRNCI